MEQISKSKLRGFGVVPGKGQPDRCGVQSVGCVGQGGEKNHTAQSWSTGNGRLPSGLEGWSSSSDSGT